jgi:peptidoglycan biosynthesis protein MviN/MurJ (putative lipid II flippase)
MLAMAVVTSAAMLAGVRSSRATSGERVRLHFGRLLRSVWLVLSSTAIYLAFNGLYVITLAFASNYETGGATVLSYAYLFASYSVAATGFALGMSRIADMRRGALADWREVIADTVPAGFRYSMLIVAPALAALIAGGASLIGELLPASFDASQVTQLKVFGALLCAWTVAALLVNLLLPAMFALGRSKLVNVLAPVVVLLHVGVTALGGSLFGINGVVGAFFVVPIAFAAVLLAVGAGRAGIPIARELIRDGLRFVLAAAACFGIGALAGDAVGGNFGPAVTIGVGGLLYVSLTPWLAPDQVRLLVGALRPASASA